MAVAPGVDPSLVLSEHGPCIIGGTITLDDASFTIKITVHSGANALAPWVSWWSSTLVSYRPSYTTCRSNDLGWGRIHRVRAELSSSILFFFLRILPLQTSTSVHLSVQLLRADEPTCSLVVWACVVTPSVVQHAVLLGRDSWVRFNRCSCHSLPPVPPGPRIFGELG